MAEVRLFREQAANVESRQWKERKNANSSRRLNRCVRRRWFGRRGPLRRHHRRRHERPSRRKCGGRRHRQSRQEPPRQTRSEGHGHRAHRRTCSRVRRVIAHSKDPMAAPKVASDFAKRNEKLVILGGAMGTTALNADGVKALATLPSLDELRARLVGMHQPRRQPVSPRSSSAGGFGRARHRRLTPGRARRHEAVPRYHKHTFEPV